MTEPHAERFTGNIAESWAWKPAAFDLGPDQLGQLTEILAILERDPHAPTAVRAPHEAAERHLADSLVGLDIDLIRDARFIADLGAGAGFPGVVLAVALPRAEVALVESQRRKCEFLDRLLAAAEVINARVVCARAEEWTEGLERNDVVVARALAPQAVVLEYAAPLLRVGGALVDWRGRRDAADEQAALDAGEELGMRRSEVRQVQPFAQATDRHLHTWLKAEPTPPRFPRRAGVARKRPLGSSS